MLSPSLLPGDEQYAVVDEFWIPGVGSADLIGVSATGTITIVECKLKANPEIRREIVGQVLAYAGGLWKMGYDQFASTFESRAKVSLPVAVAAVAGDVDADQLRDAITTHLEVGDFRLVLAVDAITPELRSIIEYLNAHTLANVQVLALELAYARDDDVEILQPVTYGEESAARKPSTSGSKWTAGSFEQELQARTSGDVRAFTEALLEHGASKGHHPFYGTGSTPGMSYYYQVEGHPTSVWALYLYEPTPKIAISLGAVFKTSPSRALALLDGLKSHPLLAAQLAGVDEHSLNKYPQIGLEPSVVEPGCRDALLTAIDGVIDAG